MRYQAFVRAAAGVLATALMGTGAALAQTSVPQPTVMTDAAPLPASERSSVGAVIMMDEPVLAQREAMLQAQERGPDTRNLGAGADRLNRRALTREEIEFQRALDAAERQQQQQKAK
jgi:hypothetical protein